MSDQQQSLVFAAWLAGELSAQQQSQFEQYCIDDDAFAQRVEQANQLNIIAESTPDWQQPEWNKEATFGFVKATPWWQWQGLSAASFACSAFAIVLVISGFNLNVENGRVSMGFGQQLPEQQINLLVQQKLDEYQQTNQTMFAQYVDAIQSQQKQNGAQLTEYLLSSSRQERREDFAELIKFVNEQRSDDQVFYARQLNNLQQEIYAQNGARVNNPTADPINTQLPNE